MTDDLTDEERAAYRPVSFKYERREGRFGFGVSVKAHSWELWRVTIHVWRYEISLTFSTLRAYRDYVLALGPYRNA